MASFAMPASAKAAFGIVFGSRLVADLGKWQTSISSRCSALPIMQSQLAPVCCCPGSDLIINGNWSYLRDWPISQAGWRRRVDKFAASSAGSSITLLAITTCGLSLSLQDFRQVTDYCNNHQTTSTSWPNDRTTNK